MDIEANRVQTLYVSKIKNDPDTNAEIVTAYTSRSGYSFGAVHKVVFGARRGTWKIGEKVEFQFPDRNAIEDARKAAR